MATGGQRWNARVVLATEISGSMTLQNQNKGFRMVSGMQHGVRGACVTPLPFLSILHRFTSMLPVFMIMNHDHLRSASIFKLLPRADDFQPHFHISTFPQELPSNPSVNYTSVVF